ncbi:MAG: hypothetical protein ACLGG7_01935 [Bacteriovoracia bacterium]
MLATLLLTFSGQFAGPGVAITPRRERTCREIFVDVNLMASTFRLHQGGYICQDLQATYDSYQMSIVDGDLFSGSQKVGRVTTEALEISYENDAEGFTYGLRLRPTAAGGLSYEETWREGEKEALRVFGKLDRLN